MNNGLIDWNQQLEDEVVRRLIKGETVKSIFRDDRLPSKDSFYYHCYKDADFAARIARARAHGAIAQFDDFLALADEADAENHNAIKLRLWARTWYLGRLDPSKYGDKMINAWDANSPLEIVIRRVGLPVEEPAEPRRLTAGPKDIDAS